MKIGIIGAGQLGRMLALAGIPLGLNFRFLDPNASAPGGQVAPLIASSFHDTARLLELADGTEVVTFDWENVAAEPLEALGARARILPPAQALATSQDRLLEKELFRALRIPVPRYAAVDTRADLVRAVEQIGVPGVLKTRRLGYDGKGQAVISKAADIDVTWSQLGTQQLIYESFVRFSGEVSVIGARSRTGEIRCYPLCANTHAGGILRHTLAPYVNPRLQKLAETYLRRVLRHFDYAGILTLEFFVQGGKLLANETAPRVHNSGHWTIEGAVTSQFENHLRAILGWPLGSTEPVGHSAMLNFISALPDKERWLGEPNLYFHDYGKTPRPGRKVGHCTINHPTRSRRDKHLQRLFRMLPAR